MAPLITGWEEWEGEGESDMYCIGDWAHHRANVDGEAMREPELSSEKNSESSVSQTAIIILTEISGFPKDLKT